MRYIRLRKIFTPSWAYKNKGRLYFWRYLLFPIAASTNLFQSVIVDSKAFCDVFFQTLCCPLAKASGYDTAHTIPQGNNHIKVIEGS